jgi:uncharacterized protein YndB with AHSA1/START domain
MNDYGTMIATDTIRFERLLPGPIERIWAYLTDSDKRAQWLAAGPMALYPGGAMEFHFRNAELSRRDDGTSNDCRAPEKYRDYENAGSVYGRVLRCEPPRLLVYTWNHRGQDESEGASEVRFELAPQGDRVRLTLTHRRLLSDGMLSTAAGWHTHLGILEDRLHDREMRPFWRTHTALEVEYENRLTQDG